MTENPLVTYKKTANITWPKIAKKTGLSLPGLFLLARKKPDEMGTAQIATALVLKKTLGVDLIEYFERSIK